MLVLEVNHHKTFVKNADSNDLELIKKALTVFKQKFMTSIYSTQKWDITYLFSYKDFSFPTGYLSELLKYCDEHNISVDVTDNRKYKAPYLFKLFIKKQLDLRVDQKEAFAEIRENNLGIISMPTATGKSRLIVKTIELRKVRTLILVPTSNLQTSMANLCKNLFGKARVDTEVPIALFEQIKRGIVKTDNKSENIFKENKPNLYESFSKKEADPKEKEKKDNRFSGFQKVEGSESEKVSPYSSFSKEEKSVNPEDKFVSIKKKESYAKAKEKMKERQLNKLNAPIKYKDIYVFCYASLKNLPQEFINQFDMIIVDEAHHSSSDEVRSFLLKSKNAGYRYFFTATPWRDHSADQKLLVASIGTNVLYELSPERAIELGSIAKPDYEQISAEQPEQAIPKTKKYRDTLNFGIIGNKARNKQIVDLAMKAYKRGENVFINVDEVSHIEILKERFKEKGVDADIIHGKLNKKNNDQTIMMVGERQTGIALGTMSVGEGTDMPNLTVIILASGGKSSIRLIQRIGRGARLGVDLTKKSFKVYDFFDWFHPTLLRHSQLRKYIYEDYFKDWGE